MKSKIFKKIKWNDIVTFKWFRRVFWIFLYGFINNYRPSAPFLYNSMRQELLPTNGTIEDTELVINRDIFPLFFYSSAVLLVPVIVFVDLFRYNFLLVICALCGIVSTCNFAWGESDLFINKVGEVFNGGFFASHIVYYATIFNLCPDKNQFLAWSSYSRAAVLLAQSISSGFGQLLMSTSSLSYWQLYCFDLPALIMAAFCVFFLPAVAKRQSTDEEVKIVQVPHLNRIKSQVVFIARNFGRSYTDKYVVKWSIWCSLTLCGYCQTVTYIQPLWSMTDSDTKNGTVEGLSALVSFFGVLLAGVSNFDWKFKGDLLLALTSLVQGFMLIFMSQIDSVLLTYLFYCIYMFMFNCVMTIVCAEIAKKMLSMSCVCYGMVFGTFVLLGVIWDTIFVSVLQDEWWYMVDFKYFFLFYGFYHFALAAVFIVVGLSYWFAKHTYE